MRAFVRLFRGLSPVEGRSYALSPLLDSGLMVEATASTTSTITLSRGWVIVNTSTAQASYKA